MPTPTSIGHTGNPAGVGTTITLTTIADIPAGSLVVVIVSQAGTAGVYASSLSDGTNTYTEVNRVVNQIAPAGTSQVFYKANAAFVASGATLTGTYPLAISVWTIGGLTVPGSTSAPLDANPTPTSGQSTTPSIATGTLAQQRELVVGMTWFNNVPGHYTEASGFSTLWTDNNSGETLVQSYQTVNSTGAVTYAPTLSSGTDRWAQILASFIQQPIPSWLVADTAGAQICANRFDPVAY